MLFKLNIHTKSRTEFSDVTQEIQQVLKKSKIQSGIFLIFVPHTTAGITINEDADPSVVQDILKELNKIIPFQDNYAHLEGNCPERV